MATPRDEAVSTETGVVVRFLDNTFRAVIPKGFDAPKPQRKKTRDFALTLYMAKKGEDRNCMVGWNQYQASYFGRMDLESWLNSTVIGARGQMGGEIEKEEKFSFGGMMARRAWIHAVPDPAEKTDDKAPPPKEVYARFEYIMAPPYFFQLAYQTPDRKELDSPEVVAFFESFHYEPKPTPAPSPSGK